MTAADVKPSDRTLIAIGALATAAGGYFLLVGLAVVPPPGRLHGPEWLALCVGLAFAAAGFSIIVRGMFGMTDNTPDLPAAAAVWLKAVYWLSAVLTVASLACIGTWIAIGDGPRHFSMSGPITAPVGETFGRFVFGAGAAIAWLIAILFAYTGIRKTFGRG